MKESIAFKLTFRFITGSINKIFSLGYDRFPSNSYRVIPLFLLGKLAKYVIGYPLGVILGGVAAVVVAVSNFIKTLVGVKVPTEENEEPKPEALSPEMMHQNQLNLKRRQIASLNLEQKNQVFTTK